MPQASIFILTEDASLRREALAWPKSDLSPQFYDDPSEALAAARDAEVWLFLWDARGRGNLAEGVLRKIRALPSAPEILLLVDEALTAPGIPGENVHEGRPPTEVLAEQVGRILGLQRVRRSSGIVGQSRPIRELISTIAQVAPLDVPVLVQGESGTGKELVARALHAGSHHASRPFVSINVGSLAETLLESELFGHEKGAFTGAVSQHAGVFERANGGTLFLDEVGEMSLGMQVKLLRVLETSEFQRVGGGDTQRSEVRLITATHRSLEDGIQQGTFRGDLYYRLKVVKIELPPLRDRHDDIPILVGHFLDEANRRHGLRRKGITREAMERLLRYAWPGNVRELRNVVNSMAVLAHADYLGPEDLPAELLEGAAAGRALPVAYGTARGGDGTTDPLLTNSLLALMRDVKEVLSRLERLEARLGIAPEAEGSWNEVARVAEITPVGTELPQDLEGAERAMIQASLRQYGGNRRKAADQLGISERTLYRKLKRFGIG